MTMTSQPCLKIPKWKNTVIWAGRIGFVAKGVVYAVVGGTAAQAAVGNSNTESSPKSAFVLLGSDHYVGTGMLIVEFVGVALYALWRFMEGLTGQGKDAKNGRLKNFFQFYLSPLVSGSMYLTYLAFIGSLLLTEPSERKDATTSDPKEDKPSTQTSIISSWYDTGAGRFGLILVGIAFLCATISQLNPALRGVFRSDLNQKILNKSKILKYCVYVTGHAGFLARAILFLLVSTLFFKAAQTHQEDEDPFVTAQQQLRVHVAGKILLFIMGFGLILYGAFACLNSVVKIFPTPSQSDKEVLESEAKWLREAEASDDRLHEIVVDTGNPSYL